MYQKIVAPKLIFATIHGIRDLSFWAVHSREIAQITAQVKTMIYDSLLYPPQENYADEEVENKTAEVYQHIYSNYYGSGMSRYNSFAA